ncbi:MAG: GAF domain-containing protein, partial [Anaerolineae bacterium]|nr:GAF domain-containing protein [Anaerolineae bacterium]
DRVMPYDGVSLWLREGTRLRVAAARGYKHPDVASAEELVGLYVDIDSSTLFRDMSDNQQVVNVGDVGADDSRFPYGEALPYKNWLGAPLIYQNQIVGVIAVEKEQPNFYSTHHEQLLLTFANQAAVALNNAQLFEQTHHRASELRSQTLRLELLNRVAVSLAQSLDIENILEITLRETAIALEIQEAAAIKIDHENDLGRIVVEYPRGHQAPNKVYPLPDNRVVARIRETLLPFIMEDFQNSPLAEDVKPFMRSPEKVQSALIVPLVVGGTVIGAMQFEVMESYYDFSEERLEIAQTLASQAAIAVQNASLFEQSVVRTHELETLFEAAQATAITLDLNEAMRRVVGQMLSALRADACSIALWDDIENKLEIHAAVNAWGDTDYADLPGTVHELSDYPVRERVLRQRQVVAMRLGQKDVDISETNLMERRGATSRLLVPLVVNDLSIGLVELEIREQNRYFETADVRLARTLASNAAVAIENARLQTETRSHIEELYIINDLSTAVSSTVDVDELFPIVRDQLPVLLDADVLYVALHDKDKNLISFPIAVQGDGSELSLRPLSVGNDEFSYVIRRRGPLLLAGSQMAEARRSFGISEPFMPDAKCFLGVPMISGEEVVGVLAVQDDENPRAFGLNDQRILTTVAAQLGVAIQNARLFEQTTELAEDLERRVNDRTSELQQERERVSTLYDITSEVAASLDIQRILSVALEKVAHAVGATTAVILGIDEISERLHVLHAYGEDEPVPDEIRTQLAQDEGLAGWVLANQTNVVIEDVQHDPRWLVTGDRDRRQRAAMASLLQGGDDVRGVMMLFSEKPGAFNDDHLKLIAAAASQLANAMNNSELYSLIRDQAERLGAILRTEQIESTKNTAIINSVADGVMYANEAGTIVLFNTAAERVLQMPAERMVNRPIRELAGLYGGSGGEWLDAIDRWTSDPASYTEGDFVELSLGLEDGRTINVRLSPVNMGDQFLGTVSVIRDITRLMEVDRLKTEFVSTVSHELRTPMTSIKGYADLLLLGAAGEISEAQQRFLETIKQNADRLSILVNDLLEVSKIDQNRVPLRFTEVEIPDLMERTRAHLDGRMQDMNKPLSISMQLDANLPKIWADYDKTVQVMQNLADNAFNYTHEGGAVTLAAHQEGDAVVMSVTDTGVGIPEEIQHRVFDRFFRGDE